jgi:hypothetical protein
MGLVTPFGFWLEKTTRAKIIYDHGLRWDDFYKQKENTIDVLFIGSSHCYRTFNPVIFDTILDCTSFNLGSGGQSPFTGFFVLKEALDYQNPKVVLMEVFYGPFEIADDFENAMYNYDYMREGGSKKAMYRELNLKDKIRLCFPAYRFSSGLKVMFSKEKVNADLYSKSVYMGRGYVETDLPPDFFKPDTIGFKSKEIKIQDKQIAYFDSIEALCRRNNAQLVLVTQPVHPAFAYRFQYIDPNGFLDSLAAKHNLLRIDGNKLFNGYFTGADFYDSHHFNKNGATRFSKLIAEQLKSLN